MPTLLVVTLSSKAWSVLKVQRQLPRGTRNGGKVIPGRGDFICKGPSFQEAISDLMRLKHWGIMWRWTPREGRTVNDRLGFDSVGVRESSKPSTGQWPDQASHLERICLSKRGLTGVLTTSLCRLDLACSQPCWVCDIWMRKRSRCALPPLLGQTALGAQTEPSLAKPETHFFHLVFPSLFYPEFRILKFSTPGVEKQIASCLRVWPLPWKAGWRPEREGALYIWWKAELNLGTILWTQWTLFTFVHVDLNLDSCLIWGVGWDV